MVRTSAGLLPQALHARIGSGSSFFVSSFILSDFETEQRLLQVKIAHRSGQLSCGVMARERTPGARAVTSTTMNG
jgi:hypothetical protein